MTRNLFKGPNCKGKFYKLLLGLIVVYSIIVYIAMVKIGLYAGIIVLVLLILLQLLIIDSYGDTLLTHSNYNMNKSEMKTYGDREIIYNKSE